MKHRLEILNIRDSYMMGDWVLNNGKPYRWEYGDYNRSQMGMKYIEPIPLTEEILETNGFATTDGKYYYIEETENKFGYSFAIRRNRTGLFCIVCDQVVILEYVHQIQHLLRLCGNTDLANNLKLE